jgi:hypothetical protein
LQQQLLLRQNVCCSVLPVLAFPFSWCWTLIVYRSDINTQLATRC